MSFWTRIFPKYALNFVLALLFFLVIYKENMTLIHVIFSVIIMYPKVIMTNNSVVIVRVFHVPCLEDDYSARVRRLQNSYTGFILRGRWIASACFFNKNAIYSVCYNELMAIYGCNILCFIIIQSTISSKYYSGDFTDRVNLFGLRVLNFKILHS